MNVKMIVTSFAAAAMLVGCSSYSGSTATGAKPTGLTSTAPNVTSKEPESANSLPAGDSVAAPVTTNVGRVGTTRY